jgi:hypothetical protein
MHNLPIISVAEEAVNNISAVMLKPPPMNSLIPIHLIYSYSSSLLQEISF